MCIIYLPLSPVQSDCNSYYYIFPTVFRAPASRPVVTGAALCIIIMSRRDADV